MATKQQNFLIIGVAILISAGIWIFSAGSKTVEHFGSRVFKVKQGWGYEVLVNDTVIIHQESIPALAHEQGFPEKEQAAKTAKLVILKLEKGKLPTLTQTDLDQILRTTNTNNDRENKME